MRWRASSAALSFDSTCDAEANAAQALLLMSISRLAGRRGDRAEEAGTGHAAHEELPAAAVFWRGERAFSLSARVSSSESSWRGLRACASARRSMRAPMRLSLRSSAATGANQDDRGQLGGELVLQLVLTSLGRTRRVEQRVGNNSR